MHPTCEIQSANPYHRWRLHLALNKGSGILNGHVFGDRIDVIKRIPRIIAINSREILQLIRITASGVCIHEEVLIHHPELADAVVGETIC